MIHYCNLMEWKKLHCMKEDFWDFEENEWKYFHDEMMDKISFEDGKMKEIYMIGRDAIPHIYSANIFWERWPDQMKEVCKVEEDSRGVLRESRWVSGGQVPTNGESRGTRREQEEEGLRRFREEVRSQIGI